MSQSRAEALCLMFIIGLMIAVLLVEYIEAVRPLPSVRRPNPVPPYCQVTRRVL